MDHRRARGERGGHQRVLGGHHRRLVHEEVAGAEARRARRGGRSAPHAPRRRARGRRRGAGRAGGGRSRRRRAAACRRGRSGRAAGRRAGRTRGCARPARGPRPCSSTSSARSATTLSSRHSAFTPSRTSSSIIASTSRIRGTLRSTTSSSVSKRGGERRQSGVLVPRGDDGAREGRAAFDDELLHARIPGRAAVRAAWQGYRRPFATGFGSQRRIPCPAMAGAAPTRDEAWELVCEWTESDSLRKHVLGVEAAMRAYAERSARTRSSRASPGSSTTSTTSGTRTWSHRPPAHGARRSSSERGYPDELIDAVAGPRRLPGRARARRRWPRRSTPSTSCPASWPPARSCAPPASRA